MGTDSKHYGEVSEPRHRCAGPHLPRHTELGDSFYLAVQQDTPPQTEPVQPYRKARILCGPPPSHLSHSSRTWPSGLHRLLRCWKACGKGTELRVKGPSSGTSNTTHLLGDLEQDTISFLKKKKKKHYQDIIHLFKVCKSLVLVYSQGCATITIRCFTTFELSPPNLIPMSSHHSSFLPHPLLPQYPSPLALNNAWSILFLSIFAYSGHFL